MISRGGIISIPKLSDEPSGRKILKSFLFLKAKSHLLQDAGEILNLLIHMKLHVENLCFYRRSNYWSNLFVNVLSVKQLPSKLVLLVLLAQIEVLYRTKKRRADVQIEYSITELMVYIVVMSLIHF